jgi:phosphate transport system substrate-binding protein
MISGRMQAMLVALIAASSLSLTCSQAEDPTSGHVVIIGSESVWRAMDDEAREFMTMYGRATARAVKMGSVAGLQTLFSAPGVKDTFVAVTIRPLSESESLAAARQGYTPSQYRVGMDGIAFIVNAANPVESLAMDQVRDILSGRITNWQQVGGRNRPIQVYLGTPKSGTYQQILDSVMHGAGLARSTRFLDSAFAIIRAVQEDPDAIGYCGSSYLYRDWVARPPIAEPDIKALALARQPGGPYVAPDPGTIYDKSYPLWRYVYLVSRREPKGVVSGFITFVMSSKGQQVLVRDGLAPVTVKFTVKREETE